MKTNFHLHLPAFFAVFPRIFAGLLFPPSERERLYASIRNKENHIGSSFTPDLPKIMYLTEALTARAISYLQEMPDLMTSEKQVSDKDNLYAKIEALLQFLELKEIILKEFAFQVLFPLEERGSMIFDPKEMEEEEIWNRVGPFEMIDALSKSLLSKAHQHDCDTCDKQGNCPIEEQVRSNKLEAEKEEIPRVIHISSPKSSKDIN